MRRGSESTAVRSERPAAPLPLVLSWDEAINPLPIRPIRAVVSMMSRPLGLEAPPWLETGPADQPFAFCERVARLCGSIAARCEELHHIDVSRLLFAVTQARSSRTHGLQARVTPLRFRGGAVTRLRRGVRYQVQRYVVGGRDMLYLITFCLPRFLELDFDEKFITLFHELYHIAPAFDGDLRRHEGRYSLHSRSQRLYDRHMAALAREYLGGGGDPNLHAFLRMNFAQLQHRHGSVTGIMVPRPKVIPVDGE